MRFGPTCRRCRRVRPANTDRASIERLVEHDLTLALDVAFAQVEAVRAVAHGDLWVRANGGRVLAKHLTKKDPVQSDRERYERLTVRERDVLKLVGQGYSAPEIGERLFISPKTVDTYKQRIQEKLNISHRSHYVQLALKLGLLAQS